MPVSAVTAEYIQLVFAGLSVQEQAQLVSKVLNTIQPIGAVNGQLASLIDRVAGEFNSEFGLECDQLGGGV